MITEPRVERRREQPYVAIRALVPIPFGDYLPPLWNEVRDWLTRKGITSTGPAMIRYLTTDMTKELTIEVGFALEFPRKGDERVITGVLPAGHYALLVYTGPYEGNGLTNATREMLEWGKQNDLVWKTTLIDGVEWWEARVEWYLVDPAKEADPEKWQTEIAILVDSIDKRLLGDTKDNFQRP